MRFLQRIISGFQEGYSSLKHQVWNALEPHLADDFKIIFLQDKFILHELMKRARDSQQGYAVAHIRIPFYPMHFMAVTDANLLNRVVQYGEPRQNDPNAYDPEARMPFKDIKEFLGLSVLPNETGPHVLAERKVIKENVSAPTVLAETWKTLTTILNDSAQQSEFNLGDAINLACTKILGYATLRLPTEAITPEVADLLKRAEHALFNRVDRPSAEFYEVSRTVKETNDKITHEYHAAIANSDSYLNYVVDIKKAVPNLAAANGVGELVAAGNITALVMGALIIIASNPQLQTKLQAAFKELGEIDAGVEGYDKLKKNRFMHQLYLEALRYLSPQAPIVRFASKKATLGTVKLTDEKTGIEKEEVLVAHPRTYMFVTPRVILHDPKHWPNPENFDPERFEDPFDQHVAQFPFIPFSMGQRSCPASQYFIEMVFKLTIYSVFKHFDLQLNHPKALEEIPVFTRVARTHEEYRVSLKKREVSLKKPEASSEKGTQELRRSLRIATNSKQGPNILHAFVNAKVSSNDPQTAQPATDEAQKKQTKKNKMGGSKTQEITN